MTEQERARLRQLAARQLEAANSPVNLERTALWKRHNARRGERPVIHIELGTFEQEMVDPLLQCADPVARGLERALLENFFNLTEFDDDKVVPDYFPVSWHSYFHLFGQEIARTTAADSHGSTLGHQFVHVIDDLREDFPKLGASRFGVDEASTARHRQAAEDAFGDILPVRMSGHALYVCPTQMVVHRMGMERMYTAMYDYPEEFLQLMERIADDTLDYFQFLEANGYLLPTTGFEPLGQGTLCFTEELPDVDAPTTRQLWGYMDSQETVGISPEMFHDFIFPAYSRIAQSFGLLSYGCCEPVHAFWDDLKTLPGLRKLSISPWCDEELMAERLGGTKTIYHRKPSPNFLGVGAELEEEAVRAHISKSLRAAAAHGCKMEITQRDVYTVNNDLGKVRRYVQLIREEIERCWKS